MAQAALVEMQMKEGQTLLERLAHEGIVVTGLLEVTWAKGGAVRIIGAAGQQRWRWSQPRAVWEEGGYPPDEVLQAIFTAVA
jgi:hypothetical protein